MRATESPKGQQSIILTPGQLDKYYGICAVNYRTGGNIGAVPPLQVLFEKHPTGTISVAWDNGSQHEDDEVQFVVRASAGRLVLLYLPTYSP